MSVKYIQVSISSYFYLGCQFELYQYINQYINLHLHVHVSIMTALVRLASHKHIDCGYTLEQPHCTHKVLCFEQKYEVKISSFFHLKTSQLFSAFKNCYTLH